MLFFILKSETFLNTTFHIAIFNSLLCMKYALFRLNGHWYGAYRAQCLHTPQGFLKSLQVSNLAQY